MALSRLGAGPIGPSLGAVAHVAACTKARASPGEHDAADGVIGGPLSQRGLDGAIHCAVQGVAALWAVEDDQADPAAGIEEDGIV